MTKFEETLRDILLVAIGDRFADKEERKVMAEDYVATYGDVLVNVFRHSHPEIKESVPTEGKQNGNITLTIDHLTRQQANVIKKMVRTWNI